MIFVKMQTKKLLESQRFQQFFFFISTTYLSNSGRRTPAVEHRARHPQVRTSAFRHGRDRHACGGAKLNRLRGVLGNTVEV
jgi:hypothetical protein